MRYSGLMTSQLALGAADALPQTSYSDLQRFANCRRSWHLGTYLGLRRKEEPMHGPLPFGGRIHKALELWRNGVFASPAAAYAALVAQDIEIAKENGLFTEHLDKEAKLGQVMLEGYVEWLDETGEDARFETLSIETPLSEILQVPTLDGEVVEVLLRGKLDRRLRRKTDNAVLVSDYKTTSSLSPDSIGMFARSVQARLYLLLERQQAPKEQWSAGFHIAILRKVLRTKASKPPYYASLEIAVSTANLRAAEQNISAVVTEMQQVRTALDHGGKPEHWAPFHISWQCKTCPFKLPCEQMQDGNWSGARDMLIDLYEVGDPFARYQRDEDDGVGWAG